jgi:hypothetical protein
MKRLNHAQRHALADAHAFYSAGLHRSDAGWRGVDAKAKETVFHADMTIESLVGLGLLRFWSEKSKTLVHITDAGSQAHKREESRR